MKITIAYLYYDLLNLYGENGNIKALIKYLENQNIEVELKKLTVNDDLYLSDYDFIYLGAGTENNQLIALEHLVKYKNEIKEYIDNNGFILATGNSLELFGKYIIDLNNKKHKSLNIFSFNSRMLNERIICESILQDASLDDAIIGFQNRGSKMQNVDNYWLTTIKNFKPENNEDMAEGIHFNNFYGTYLLGPLLVRNPLLLKEIGNKLIKSIDNNYELGDVDLTLECEAYRINKEKYEVK